VAGAVGVNAITPWVLPVPFLNSGFDYLPNEPFRWAVAKTGFCGTRSRIGNESDDTQSGDNVLSRQAPTRPG
jgi:hypothetical protein